MMAGNIVFLLGHTPVIFFLARTIIRSGELQALSPVNLGAPSTILPDLHGFEDLAATEAGLLTASSDHSHFQFVLGTSMREMIADEGRVRKPTQFFRLGSTGATPLAVRGAPRDFFPHGLATRDSLLAVVNHRRDCDAVEIFEIRNNELVHLRSLRHDVLYNLNDCTFAPSGRRLLCTNWRSQPTGGLLDAAEVYLQLPWTNVVSCALEEEEEEGEEKDASCVEVASGLQMANGIEVSPNGRRVAVVSSTGKSIVVYEHDEAATTLTEIYRIDTNSACDNLSWDDQGRLLAGCHPKSLTFVHYSKRPHERTAPCEVVRVDIDAREVSTLYLDPTGAETSACSIAAVGGDGTLFVGTIHSRGLRVFPAGWEAKTVPQAATRGTDWRAVLFMLGLLGTLWSVPVLMVWRCSLVGSRRRLKRD